MTLADTLDTEIWRLTGGGKVMRPPRHRGSDGRWSVDREAQGTDRGEWDWFYSLPNPERAYVQAHHMIENGVHPDVVAERMGCSVDEAMHQWLEVIRARRSVHVVRDEWEEPDWACLPDFLGLLGIAVIFGVKDDTPRQWRKRGKLPAPSYMIDNMHPIWSRETIGHWLDQISTLG